MFCSDLSLSKITFQHCRTFNLEFYWILLNHLSKCNDRISLCCCEYQSSSNFILLTISGAENLNMEMKQINKKKTRFAEFALVQRCNQQNVSLQEFQKREYLLLNFLWYNNFGKGQKDYLEVLHLACKWLLMLMFILYTG